MYNVLTDDAYIMYLRKSRQDNPDETVEEVLSKHEGILQEWAEKNLGGRIPDHCIYREIVSGETIAERPEMLNVMIQLENPKLKGVLVVEPQRLSRGDLEDCGKIVNAFRYSSTEVVTPYMTYDLTNKMQRKFFEQELLRGNDYLEYTKEILLRGRIAAIKRGCYIGNIPPFGYNKIVDEDGNNTLEPNEYAPAVLMAYEMYVNEDKTALQIARHFDSLGIKPYRSKIWEKCSIKSMLKNRHYIGQVVFGSTRTEKVFENGQLTKHRNRPTKEDDVIIAKGKHPAIVPLDLWEAAQEKTDNNPRTRSDAPLRNPLAGLIFCHHCGKALYQRPYAHARTRIECRNTNGCGAKSTYLDELVEAVAVALEHEQLPDLEAKLKNNEGQAASIQRMQLEKMGKELAELETRQSRLLDFLESGTYTEEMFVKRNNLLQAQMEDLKSSIFECKKNMPKDIDYGEKIVKLKKAIAGMRDPDMSIEDQNKLLKTIVDRVDYEFLERLGKGKARYRLHIKLLV